MKNTIAKKELNTQQNGVELYFNVYPLNATRETLKKGGFRWNHKKGCWYAKQGLQAESIADICADTTIEEYKLLATETGETITEIKAKQDSPEKKNDKQTKTKEVKNKYGIKKGDFFSMSWGYEQTNITHFQVVELVGSCSARVKEVYPEIVSREAICGMSEDRIYKYNRSKLAPAATSSVFVDDCEHGDLKQIRLCKWSKEPRYYISFDHGYYHAYLVTTDTAKEYVSWYY